MTYIKHNGKFMMAGGKILAITVPEETFPIDPEKILMEVGDISENPTTLFRLYGANEEISIDWGDGTVIPYMLNWNQYIEPTHTYTSPPESFIKISNAAAIRRIEMYEDAENIKAISIPPVCEELFDYLNIQNVKNLEIINMPDIIFPNFEFLNIYQNDKLKTFKLPVSPNITVIQIFENKSLTSVIIPEGCNNINRLWVAYNSLTSFIIPNDLTALEELLIGNNKLSSLIIPNELTNLIRLDIGDNQLTSLTIPPELINLENLWVGINQLTSLTIPSELTKLTELTAWDNQLTSLIIPPELVNLENLQVGNNRLTSITIPSELINLVYVYLNFNQLTSVTIPPESSNISQIDLMSNKLTSFTVHPTWENLESIQLTYNMLTESNINQLLIDISTYQLNNFNNGYAYLGLSGYYNAIPTGDGLAAKEALEDLGNYIEITDIPYAGEGWVDGEIPNLINLWVSDIIDDSYIPDFSAFNLDPARNIIDIIIDPMYKDTLLIFVDVDYTENDEIYISYEKPVTNSLRAFSGFEVESFEDMEIDNYMAD